MTQHFRLTNQPGGLGLSCTREGLALAGVPLLHKTERGFAPRPPREIDALLRSGDLEVAYPRRLRSSLDAIADALNRGDLAHAGVVAVLTRTPECSRAAAARLAKVEESLAKYSADEPRDWRGRWTDGASGAPPPAPSGAPRPVQVAQNIPRGDGRVASDPSSPAFAGPQLPAEQENGGAQTSSTPAVSRVPKDERDDAAAATSDPLLRAFEQRYDDLHPVDFAKAVLQFGDHLERQGKDLPPTEKAQARAEYAFLQDRLSFWLAYEYTPPEAVMNLRGAALALYRGAIFAGIARPGQIPYSMLAVAGELAFFNNAPPPRLRLPAAAATEEPSYRVPGEAPREPEGLGGTVGNRESGINWSGGIKDQGEPLEAYLARQNPALKRLGPTSKTFDLFDHATGSAVSAKTLNTLSVSYIKNPQSIYSRVAGYVDAAANYKHRVDSDLRPLQIESRTIQLAVPEYTSPTQWRYLYWAILYGKEREVSVIVTRIRE